MTDIVQRLRDQGKDAFAKQYSLGMYKLCDEAAAEIERLRAALAATPAVGGERLALANRLDDFSARCDIEDMGTESVDLRDAAAIIRAAAQPASPLRGREVLKHCDELHDLGFNAGWNGAIEAAALIVQPVPHVNEERRCEDIAAKIRALSASPPEQPADPLSDLVSGFAKALLAKLRLASANGRSGWERDDWEKQCQQGLLRHIDKGDPRDVAAYCAFMWHHGWITAPPEQPAAVRKETDDGR